MGAVWKLHAMLGCKHKVISWLFYVKVFSFMNWYGKKQTTSGQCYQTFSNYWGYIPSQKSTWILFSKGWCQWPFFVSGSWTIYLQSCFEFHSMLQLHSCHAFEILYGHMTCFDVFLNQFIIYLGNFFFWLYPWPCIGFCYREQIPFQCMCKVRVTLDHGSKLLQENWFEEISSLKTFNIARNLQSVE